MASALNFLRTEDGEERALMQAIAYQADDLARKRASELANKIAAEVNKILGGK